MAGRTLYQRLGVARDASLVDLEAAFREKLAELKADSKADHEAIDSLREAYQVLSSAPRRAEYDETLPRLPAPRESRESSGFPAWIKWGVPCVMLFLVAVWWARSPKVVKPVAPLSAQSESPPRAAQTSDTATVAARPSPPEVPRPLPATASAPVPAGKEGSAEDVFAQVSESIARIRVSDASGQPASQGSGVVIAAETVITNCHVMTPGGGISVKVGREEYSASVDLADEELDLCRLSVTGLAAPSVTIVNLNLVRTGQRVYAIGAPHGLELTISEGIVSSMREVSRGTVIQTTAPISPGSSGGGLFDVSGRLVGIVTFQHRYGQNLNFALPAEWIGRMEARRR